MKQRQLSWLVWAPLLAHCSDGADARDLLTDYDASVVAADAAPPSDAAALEPLFGPLPAQNPHAAADGFATQHGDTCASDTTPLPGPGAGAIRAQNVELPAACPSVLMSSRGQPLALCTQLANRVPTVYLLAAETGQPVAQLELAKGDLFGGVYPYLDQQDRLHVVDGANTLQRIVVEQSAAGFALKFDQSISLAPHLAAGCGRDSCDVVVGLIPDYNGLIWFASASGVIGTVEPTTRRVSALKLPLGEQIANSIASSVDGVAVISDHALYLLQADTSGLPIVRARAAYDRGSARKPGQLSHGSGSTPTFFGPTRGSEYLAITDNARPQMQLLIFRVQDLSVPLCSIALPEALNATENSPIGSGRSVFVSNTYGYPYPALPEGAPPSSPDTASFVGGMARIDVALDERSCSLVWSNRIRSAAVPKLSLADRLIYTFERRPPAEPTQGAADSYAYTAIDPISGELAAQQVLPGLADTLQLAGTIGPHRVLFQGTMRGLVRIAAASE